MKTFAVVVCLVATVASAQELAGVGSTSGVIEGEVSFQDDPGQALYKKGYAAILDKKWDLARSHFADLVKKYPKSKYIDAAKYWTAYTYAQTDREKAESLYEQFLEQYRDSQYFDDAVADYEKLAQGREKVAVVAPVPPIAPRPSVRVPDAPRLRDMEHAWAEPKREVDPALQLKMDAIRALGADADDAQAYETVKAIAVDPAQPMEIREAALQTVGRFKGQDPVPVYLQVASSGEVRLRQAAIYGLANTADQGDERVLQALRTYARDGSQPREVREASLAALTRLDGTGMLDLLNSIAKSDPDRGVRVQAVYLIGRSGKGNEDKALETLKAIASDESQHREVRESALQALSMVRSDASLSYVKGVATSSKDKQLRLSALYALSRYQDEPSAQVGKIFRTIAQDPNEDSELRLVALYALRPSAGTASREFLTSLALKDADTKIRQAALHILIEESDEKTAMLSTLIEVFEKSGEENKELRETALYGIANVGNDQAVAYLAKVAKNHADYELRRRAVYYLGSVGGDEAKAALLEILKQP